MSAKCLGWVLENTNARNTDQIILIRLADYANADSHQAWPSVQTLADKANVGKSTCQQSLRRLEAEGRIAVVGKTRWGTVVYEVLMTPEAAVGKPGGVKSRPPVPGPETETGGVQNLDPGGVKSRPKPKTEPKTEPTTEPPHTPPSPNRTVARFNGKAVDPDSWALTEQVLASYNEQAGSKLRLTTSAGQPSMAAQRIYSRIRAYPDITFSEYEGIIHRTLASRWWGNGPPGIGVVFGPKVFEDNITRPGTAYDKHAERRERNERRKEAGQRAMAARQQS